MSSFVELSVAGDATLELIAFVEKAVKAADEKASSCYDACVDLAHKGKAKELVVRLCEQHAALFQAVQDSFELENTFDLIFSLLVKVDAKDLAGVVDSLLKNVLTEPKADGASFRLKLATNLYNILPPGAGAVRYSVFYALVQYASESGQFASIEPALSGVDGWCAEWKVDTQKTRALFLLIQQSLKKEGNASEAHVFIKKYLHTFDKATGKDLDASREAAQSAVVEALTAMPTLYHFEEYLNMPAVKHLETSDANAKALYSLLNIVVCDDLPAFTKFSDANKAVFDQLSLCREELLRKMRLLSLCSLANSHALTHLAFKDIATALNISEDEVESQVILCVNAALMDAKIDQQTRTVTVQRVSQRLFSEEQWTQLRDRLQSWRTNVRALIQVVHTAHLEHSAAMTATKAQ